jgi:hypothetical protein
MTTTDYINTYMDQDVNAIGYFSYLNSAYKPTGMKLSPRIMRIIQGIVQLWLWIKRYPYTMHSSRHTGRDSSRSLCSAQVDNDDASMNLNYDSLPMLLEGTS